MRRSRLTETEELLQLAALAGVRRDPRVLGAIHLAIATDSGSAIDSISEVLWRAAQRKGVPYHPYLPGPEALPPGEIVLGQVVDGVGAAFALTPVDLMTHLLCGGTSGSGKTTFMMFLATQLIQLGVSVWVFDVDGAYSRLTQLFGPDLLLGVDVKDVRRNPLQVLPGEGLRDVLVRLEAISYEQYLRDTSLNMLGEVVAEITRDAHLRGQAYPTLRDYREVLVRMKPRPGSRPGDARDSLLNRVTGVLEYLGETYGCVEGWDLAGLMERSLVIQLGGLDRDALSFFVLDLIGAVVAARRRMADALARPLVMFLDEAHLVVPPRQYGVQDRREPLICTYTRQVRKVGVGLVLACASPKPHIA